jgi:hypothetical protein
MILTLREKNKKMENYKIIIDGKKQFKNSYLIYIIEIEYNCIDKYFYIGQTGDRNHKSARPPFFRLSGHLNQQEKSTENQIYKGIVEQILKLDWNNKDDLRIKVNNFLINSIITMTVFPIFDYNYEIEMNLHKNNRIKVEEIENLLISEYIKKYDRKKILNKKYTPNKHYSDEIKKYVYEILKEMGN